ncbi:cytochrome b/b6 domain-containing protein [Halomonas sp. HP20-15]|uniref:cytochrome b n=1 Tax=Halomonas sp. HP20-15 TaxID=3085901 RepID=UPI002980A605|nr:cytochrome b/b6 domain-containing protein [Halomonas sp. HP20-15]MDW5376526.1 cytochrome b/b6 domain-containing protein [Halomonas sp. HP20-15]
MLRQQWRDTPDRYGSISRWLHWGIGVLLLWQLGGMATRALVGPEAWVQLWISTHRPLGTLLMGLIALRASWALFNLPRRPPHRGLLARLAACSHLLLYLLMLAMPALGLYMTWLSGQPFAPLGIPLFKGGSSHVDQMLLARQWHAWLGWTLLALIIGHAGMALLWHALVRRDGTLGRMAGRGR